MYQSVINPVETAAKSTQKQGSFAHDFPKFFTILAELAFLFYVIYKFQIEQEHSLPLITPSLFFGFIVYNLIPLRFRLPFFFCLFCGTLGLLIGPANAAILVAIGLGLLLLCHLPASFSVRVVAVVAAAILLAAIRIGAIATSWGHLIVPLIASMFMFRIILYLYEMKHNSVQAGPWQRICYFFLLPNICLPLFPIVDFKTYLSSYFQGEPYEIYQKGVHWMTRGIVQILIYRVVYMFLLHPAYEITDLKSFALYLFSSYMLVLKIAGQAHFAVGALCLFGFNLPAVFNNYLLASGFTDLWRRVNIYWKDFMMKIFYYPAYFVFKKAGIVKATVISLLLSFLATWILHSYQFFWLVGRFPILAIDGIFWTFFGLMVAVNSVLQMKRTKRKTIGKKKWKFQDAAKQSFKVISFFSFMCLLWSFWDSASVPEWLSIMSTLQKVTLLEIGGAVLIIAVAVLIGAVVQIVPEKTGSFRFLQDRPFYRAAVLIFSVLSIVTVMRMYRFYAAKPSTFADFVHAIQEPRQNERDSENRERGYYQPLFNNTQLNSDFFTLGKLKPTDWKDIWETKASRSVNDFLLIELTPNYRIEFKTNVLTTNRWGMRDRDYEQKKPPGTYRFALLGGSIDMGSGVPDQGTYENLTEDRLNHENTTATVKKFEILNFAVGGYDEVRNARLCDTRVLDFQPDAVMIVSHTGDAKRTVDRFIDIVDRRVDLQYDFIKELVRKTGVHAGMDHSEAKKRLLPYSRDLLQWAYGLIAQRCKEHNIVPVWLYIPAPTRENAPGELEWVQNTVHGMGYVMIDLSNIYAHHDYRKLQIAPWDEHPNQEGHELIANALYEKLLENAQSLHITPK